jgi:hypothetical protein
MKGDYWYRITAVDRYGRESEPTPARHLDPSTQSAYAANTIPGRIEAENFDRGLEGYAYHDSEPANQGGCYRGGAVDLAVASDDGGGYCVGWTVPGEWLEYTITAALGGNYELRFRVASPVASGRIRVLLNGQELGTQAVPKTGGWQSWATITLPSANLPAGKSLLRLEVVGGDFNVNWMEFHSVPKK